MMRVVLLLVVIWACSIHGYDRRECRFNTNNNQVTCGYVTCQTRVNLVTACGSHTNRLPRNWYRMAHLQNTNEIALYALDEAARLENNFIFYDFKLDGVSTIRNLKIMQAHPGEEFNEGIQVTDKVCFGRLVEAVRSQSQKSMTSMACTQFQHCTCNTFRHNPTFWTTKMLAN